VSTGADVNRTLLILDDEVDARDIMKLVFEPLGYTVYGEEDGAAALVLLSEREIAVALVDLLMPGMSGRQFLEEMALLPGKHRPVVIVNSARRPAEVREEILGLDVFDILSKPFELRDVEGRVDRACAEKARRDGERTDP
jgi:CheY-like chemotaxis protein